MAMAMTMGPPETALTPAQVVRRSAGYLARHGVESPRATAEILLMHLLGTDRAGLYARRHGLDTATARAFGRALCQRCAGTPVQHLTGEQAFLGLVLAVEPGVFVPRPETEVVAVAALEVLEGLSGPVAVDVGTGTGAVALAISSRRPDARVLATDVSAAAVRLAASNAARLGLEVELHRGDLMAGVPGELRGQVDLIVCNPPYVDPGAYDALPPEVKADPYEALVGGTEVHRRLIDQAPAWLRPGGWLVVEIGAEQGTAVRGLLGATWDDVEVLPDLAGRDRVVRGRTSV
jgi:release factor glutamine methyltransferase